MSPMSPRTLRPRAGGFNPASISNLGAWWDFSDSSTVSLSLSAITSVTDKSGNSRTATQSTGNNQPAIAASVRNGRSAALFDGLNDALDVTWGAQQFTAITLFAVVQPTGAGGGSLGRIYSRDGSGTFLNRANASNAFSWSMPWTSATGNGSQRTADGSASLNAWYLLSFRYTGGADVNADVFLRVNRSLSTAALAGTRDTSSTSQSSTLNIGNRTLADGYDRGWQGHIGELLIYTANLTAANVSSVESYLAVKWGF